MTVRTKAKSFFKQNTHCHICKGIIPHWIVSPVHPLFGTIDHIIPLANGGTNTADNRAPAHRMCNMHKSNRELTEEMRVKLRRVVCEMLKLEKAKFPVQSSTAVFLNRKLKELGRIMAGVK